MSSLFVPDDDDEEKGDRVLLNFQHLGGEKEEPQDDNGFRRNGGEDEEGRKEEEEEEEEEEEDLYPLILKETEPVELDPIEVTLNLPLQFQQLVVEELIADDSLLILGKGLGLEPIVANLLHTVSTPATISGVKKRSLVLLLGANSKENINIAEELTDLSLMEEDRANRNDRSFVAITSDKYTSEKRQQIYRKGGVISVTSRILIVDILSGTLNASKVTGLVVLHAEKVNDLSTESTIVHMFRRRNKLGFVKAVSESVEEFASGFSPLHKSLKALRLKRVLLWPRFHYDITNSLLVNDSAPVIEIRVAMTESMKQLQTGALICLKNCIEELKRKTQSFAIDYWSIDNALDDYFLTSIHKILDPHWNELPHDAKQLVQDIKLFEDLLKSLMSYDSVHLYEIIQRVQAANKPSIDNMKTESPWLMLKEADQVITHAKKRVFDGGEYILEEQPKWEQLAILLDDINVERSFDHSKKGPVLVMCADNNVRRQLIQVITSMRETSSAPREFSFRKMMVRKLQQHLDAKEETQNLVKKINSSNAASENSEQVLNVSRAFARGPITTNRRRTRGDLAAAKVSRLLSRSAEGDNDIESKMKKEDVEMELFELSMEDDARIIEFEDEEDADELQLDKASYGEYEYIDRANQIVISKYNSQSDYELLHELMPSFIIMYDPNLAFIRRVEVYQAIHRNDPAKTYFMYYSDSVEEQKHLTAIKKEKEAFTKLIREKEALPSFFDTDEDFSKFNIRKTKAMNTRIAGGANLRDPSHESMVIVDTREFGAALPGLLWRIGLKVVPCMLTVGDYVLTSKVCIERKSIPDLIGSIRNGRLYDQCARMSEFYEIPALLIEFDEGQSFSLESFSESRTNKDSIKAPRETAVGRMQEEIQVSLAQLVMKFPKLRILWSSSPYQTAEIFVELKEQREEPDIYSAVDAGSKLTKSKKAGLNESNLLNFLQTIPGITKNDQYIILKKVKDVQKLTDMTEEKMVNLFGEDLAERIYPHIQDRYNS